VGFDGGEFAKAYSLCVDCADLPSRHLSERPLRVVAPMLGAERFAGALAGGLEAPTPTCRVEEVFRELGWKNERYLVVAPGAGWPQKQWPAEHFAAVGRDAASKGLQTVVVGASTETDLCHRVAEAVPASKEYVGRPLGRVLALLSAATGVLANDSGIAHLAAALGRPTAAVFAGHTDPARCGPLGPRVRIFGSGTTPADVTRDFLESVA
jgi:ADP-heptose:LPS heptosyltransferase